MIRSLQEEAKIYRDRADRELNSGDDSRLDYAALLLRKSVEFLAYDRLSAYQNEINIDIYDTWQPGKVIRHLCELDPDAMAERTISVAPFDNAESFKDQSYREVGKDKPISIQVFKKDYNALGSYLHAPILKKLNQEKTIDTVKLRALCSKILSEIDRALSSTVWATAIGLFSRFECARCKNTSIFRDLSGSESKRVWCSKCNAPHTIFISKNNNLVAKPHMKKLVCATSGCDYVHQLWEDDFEYEKSFDCKECKSKFRYIYAVQPVISNEVLN